MLILVINSGSSSLKYQLIDTDTEDVLCKGLAERIGIEGGRVSYEKTGQEKVFKDEELKNHTQALEMIMEMLLDDEIGSIDSIHDIGAIGHRIVNGGELFIESVLVDENTIEGLESVIDMAPLHNPPAIAGIRACQEIFGKDTPMSLVVDTAWLSTMPKKNYIYALPYEMYEKYKVRRYGAHGTSHKYVTYRLAEILGKKPEELNLITCHLGNGSSLTAVKNGKCYDTSMGFTPLAGVAMGTRTGDLDPSVVTFIMQKEGLSPAEMENLMNKKSGVLGLSGLSSDFRDLEKAASEGHERSQLALELFAQTVRRFLGSYLVELGHVDAIVFTAGLGENNGIMRERILDNLEELGIKIDKKANLETQGVEGEISTEDSKIKVYVIPTNEELMIARETLALIQ